jgi:hypothetical protein
MKRYAVISNCCSTEETTTQMGTDRLSFLGHFQLSPTQQLMSNLIALFMETWRVSTQKSVYDP